ncbi:hypothetical protein K450DRAFT_198023 [Umbelopsis ramanniana AG]|uniref:UBZ4-type domain-containing protein n=1 Tax=Umbelopsis ramanniana AG TaxID=1314678 RepID=A0AAD5EDZ4_UMBRA|nr:uncharacterized protein K450DRAFT_198023 [Umbelopsis ramanniana AG]KAI8581270.1 hypothetical protein K450DRAFT_198023 [Umbelopsis ramanniana AG]
MLQQQQQKQQKGSGMASNSEKGSWRQENGSNEVIPSSSPLKDLVEDWLSSDEELQQHKRVSKSAKRVVKGIKPPSSNIYTISAKEEAFVKDANDSPRGGNENSPLYQTSSILTSSPVSPLFYEKIKPIVRRHDIAGSAPNTRAALESNSPLAAKHRGSQEHTQKSNLSSRADKSWKGKHTPVSRSLLPEFTSTVATTSSVQRQTIPHVSQRRSTDKASNSKRDERNTINTSAWSHIPPNTHSSTHSRMSANLADPYFQTCPICDAEFPTSVIEEHADECIGKLVLEPVHRPISSQKPLTQSLLAPLKSAKSFTVYKDDTGSQTRPKVISRPVDRQEEKECPICRAKIRADLLQKHVEEELDELSSGSVPSNIPFRLPAMSTDDNSQSSAVGKYPEPTCSIPVDDDSDSECSVIDLASESNSVNVDIQTPVSSHRPRQRSLSPVEGFQDIRQLQNDDPGYQMYFRQFGDARLDSAKSRKRRNQTAADQDDGEPGIAPTVSKRKPNRNYRKFRGNSNSRRPRQRPGRGGRK